MKRGLVLVVCFFLFSCDQEEPQPEIKKTFSGVVLDYTTGQPIPGALVKIIRFEFSDIFTDAVNPAFVRDLNSSLVRNIRVDSVLADSQGKYSIELDISRPPYNTYMVAAFREGYMHPYALPKQKSKHAEFLSFALIAG
jgi:hypothetical protein